MPENNGRPRRHVISVIVVNEPGVLARVVGLFSGRGWNIEDLTVAKMASSQFQSVAEGVSRITIVTAVSDEQAAHIMTKIGTIVPVCHAEDITDNPDKVEADISLVKVCTNDPHLQTEIATMAQVQFRAMSVRTREDFIVLRFVGQERAAQDFVRAIQRFKVDVESAHSGIVALV